MMLETRLMVETKTINRKEERWIQNHWISGKMNPETHEFINGCSDTMLSYQREGKERMKRERECKNTQYVSLIGNVAAYIRCFLPEP